MSSCFRRARRAGGAGGIAARAAGGGVAARAAAAVAPMLACAAAAGLLFAFAAAARAEPLRVCADPNNLPYSDRSESGFENALAKLAASALGYDGVAYTWLPQRRGFVRNSLNAHLCDVIMGVPVGYELAATTKPYYYSTYVFVTRTRDRLALTGFDDAALERLRIGVPAVGDDYSMTPGEIALEHRGIVRNVVGYSILGDYSKPHPPSRLIEAVAAGDIDVAIAWGPIAGYFAARQNVPLTVTPVPPGSDAPSIPFVYGMAMAVRRDDPSLRDRLNAFISARTRDIEQVLERYSIPVVAPCAAEGKDSQEKGS
ncbi:MAG TPA: quinoprotein dehydrogenase-associated putative ABC transporter substrate-binding protein [Gammaproteobacteria bacterium]|nr:quinoprotein dehydrogenase-associated putative ABC transporter substrate-binding protein [Gammaproteobacteria bacterium]